MDEKLLTKKDLLKTWWTWICWGQRCYNYERLMGLGFCHSISYALKKLYSTKEELSKALTRHMVFYNVENTWGALITGVSVATEEEHAKNPEVSDPELVNNLKTALMGPIAGIGDSVTQGIVRIILLGIGIEFAKAGSAFGPLLYFMLFTLYSSILSYFLFFQGYRVGKEAVVKILQSDLTETFTGALKVMSMMVVGGLAAGNIKATTKFVVNSGQTKIVVQDMLDKIVPNLIPLVILSIVLYLLRKKHKSATFVLILLFIIGFICSFLNILA